MKYTKRQQKAARKLWVKALRSGEYKQGQGRLCTKDDKMCCLGVACDLAIKKGILKAEWADAADLSPVGYPGANDGKYLKSRSKKKPIYYPPKAVTEWLGLAHEYGKFTDSKGDIVDLAGKNDFMVNDKKHKFNFDKIAEIIEEEPEGLFVP